MKRSKSLFEPFLRPDRRRLLWLSVLCGYLVLFTVLYPLAGAGIAALAVMPVVAAGWLLGWQIGMLSAVLMLLINTALLNLFGEHGLGIVFQDGGGPGTIAMLVVGVVAGRQRQLLDRLQHQADEIKHERAMLGSSMQASCEAQLALQESEARFRTLIQELQVGVMLQGPQAEILLFNQTALDLLGLSEAQLLGKTSFDPDWNVVHQDGTPFPGPEHPVPRAIATHQAVRNVVMGVYRPASSDRIWLHVDAQPQLAADGSVKHVICTFSDITKHQHAELALRRHDAIMEAISFAAASFLTISSWEDAIQPVLERLGLAAAVSRVYLFANHLGEDGALQTSQRYEWAAAGVAPSIDDQRLQRVGYQAAGFGRWEDQLSQGQLIYGHVSSFPAAERALLSSHAIESVMVVPIFVGPRWWGFIGFDQCDRERDWSISDIDALKVAAGIIGATIERERVDATLRESERRYRDLFAAARRQTQDLALLNQIRTALARELDPQVIFRIVVEAIADTFGYTQVSLYLLDGELLRIQHQVGYEHVIEQIPLTQGISGRVARTGQPILLENASTDPAFLGAIAGIVSEICVPLFDQGRVVGILNVESVDGIALGDADLRLVLSLSEHVTIAIERARLYTSARESERKYRSVVDSIKEVVFQIDLDGAWTFLNPAWAEITGWSVGSTLGRPSAEYFHPDDLPIYTAAVQALAARQHLYCEHELRCRTSEGAIRWLDLFARPIFDSNGVMVGITGTLADITVRKRAEEERSSIEQKMLEAQKLESLGVLAGGIAHDFNNLLMAILGNADLIMFDLPPDSPLCESVTQIQVTAKRAAELTNQMLAYAGKGRFVIQRFDLNLLVEEITVLLQVSIPKTALLRYNLAANLPPIEGDAAQIRQIVMNLVINAAEAIGDQEGLITISTGVRYVDQADFLAMRLAPDLPAGAYVFLQVNDTGCGMDAPTLAKIFEPFYTTKFTGRGLGLAAVLGIVRGHDGAMDVHSALGVGTTFTVLLPLADDVYEAAPRLVNLTPVATRNIPKRVQSHTLLVVDDESGVRAVATSLLERTGFRVLTAGDGRAAVELFRTHAHEISAVLLDLMMPQMNGEEALGALRAIRPDIPVVIMSGYNQYELTSRFAGVEALSFLQKPFTLQTLYSCINRSIASGLVLLEPADQPLSKQAQGGANRDQNG